MTSRKANYIIIAELPSKYKNPELMVAGNNPMQDFISIIKYLNLMIQIHVAEVLLTHMSQG